MGKKLLVSMALLSFAIITQAQENELRFSAKMAGNIRVDSGVIGQASEATPDIATLSDVYLSADQAGKRLTR